jgi:hypothetical protein
LNRGTWEILFSWQGHSSTYATWEKVTDFKLAYPAVQVGDALFLGEGGNVVDSFIRKVYRRRRPVRKEQEANQSQDRIRDRIGKGLY